MNKTIVTLVTICVLLFFIYLIANYYTEYKRSVAKPDFIPLKFKLNESDLDRIVVLKDINTIELIKTKGKWIVKDIKYPADTSKIFGLISRLNEIKQGKIVSLDPGQFDVYNVGPKTGIKVTFLSGSKEISSVVIGKNNENNTGSFIKLPAENKVFLVESLLENEVAIDKQFWIKKELKNIERNNIYKIILRGEVNYTFIKSGKKWWIKKPRIAPANEAKIKDIIDKYSYILIADIDITKSKQECIKNKPRYKLMVKYTDKKDNSKIKKRFEITIGEKEGQGKENYYAITPGKKTCFLISPGYVEPLRIAWFEAIERELVPGDMFAHEVAKIEFNNFIPGKADFKKKKLGKDNYKWLSSYKGKFKLFKYDKIRNIIELLKGIKIEDYLPYNQTIKFNRSFLIKTETKDIFAYSIFHTKDSKECTAHTNRIPKLLIKVLCSDITQIEDNIKKLLKVKAGVSKDKSATPPPSQ